MTDWTAALHPTAAGMPPMQQPATITPQQGGYKISQPPDKVKAPPALKQPKPAVPFKPAKPVKQPKAPAAQKGANVNRTADKGFAEFWTDKMRGKPEWADNADEVAEGNARRSGHPEPGSEKKSSLAGEDRRWVELESARFVAANRDTLDDSHELAVRAHNHAAAKTSTFTRQRSAAVCEAFVRKVTQLGEQQYRPAPQRTAAINTNFPGDLMFL